MEPRDPNLDALWNQLWDLEQRVQRGEVLVLTDEVRELLARAAPTVAISEAEAATALSGVESATSLLRTMRARIRDGSRRLGNALHRMYRLQEKGSLDEARQEMRDLLEVEVVPLYRRIAQEQLEALGE
jgi:DUSAM domain-containing protein